MNTQIKGNKSKLLTFAIAGKITVGTTSPNVKNKKSQLKITLCSVVTHIAKRNTINLGFLSE